MRLAVAEVEAMMAAKPQGTTLEAALEVFEVFASGSLTDEVYVLDDVSGKRIAIAPRELKERYRTGLGQGPRDATGSRLGDPRRASLRSGLARPLLLQLVNELPLEEVLLERREVELARRLVDQLAALRPGLLVELSQDPFEGPLHVRLAEAHQYRSRAGGTPAD